ncbi:hypothetical protein ACQPYE_19015 [Actinosynnema sp. CA-299493]
MVRVLGVWATLVEAGWKHLPGSMPGPRTETGTTPDPRLVAEVGRHPADWLRVETGALARSVEVARELGVGDRVTTLITSVPASSSTDRDEFDGRRRTAASVPAGAGAAAGTSIR